MSFCVASPCCGSYAASKCSIRLFVPLESLPRYVICSSHRKTERKEEAGKQQATTGFPSWTLMTKPHPRAFAPPQPHRVSATTQLWNAISRFPFVLLSPSTTSCSIHPHSRSPISPSQPAVSCFLLHLLLLSFVSSRFRDTASEENPEGFRVWCCIFFFP